MSKTQTVRVSLLITRTISDEREDDAFVDSIFELDERLPELIDRPDATVTLESFEVVPVVNEAERAGLMLEAADVIERDAVEHATSARAGSELTRLAIKLRNAAEPDRKPVQRPQRRKRG